MAVNVEPTQVAFLSVADTAGINEFGVMLSSFDYQIYATEGTAEAMPDVPVTGGYSELLKLYDEYRAMADAPKPAQAALLASIILRESLSPEKTLAQNGGLVRPVRIGLLGVNVPDVAELDAGGATLLLAGMRAGIPTISNPEDYDSMLDWIEQGMPDNPELTDAFNFSNYSKLTIHTGELAVTSSLSYRAATNHSD